VEIYGHRLALGEAAAPLNDWFSRRRPSAPALQQSLEICRSRL
jgi:hypothetical protein